MNGINKDNNGDAMSACMYRTRKTTCRATEIEAKLEKLQIKKDKTSDRPDRYTDIAFTVIMKGALLSIE